jgi:hypothetical protein
MIQMQEAPSSSQALPGIRGSLHREGRAPLEQTLMLPQLFLDECTRSAFAVAIGSTEQDWYPGSVVDVISGRSSQAEQMMR